MAIKLSKTKSSIITLMWISLIFVQVALAMDHPKRSLKAKKSSSKSKPSSSKASGKSSKKKEGWGFEEALCGVFLIFFALPMIWMNERKDVKIYKVITKGRDAVVNADCNDPQEDNMMQLVHVKGDTTTEAEVADEMFGLVYNDVLKIKRTVEVYQWKETTRTEGEEQVTDYVQEWHAFAIDQDGFKDPGACDGPTNPKDDEWPCKSETFINPAVNIGQMELSDKQINKIDKYENIDLGEMMDPIQSTSSMHFEQAGYSTPENATDQYMIARPEANRYVSDDLQEPVIGDMRIKWEIVTNQFITIVAQQVINEEKSDRYTFRAWNPSDPDASIGAEEDVTEANCPVCCFPCWCVEKCFKTLFREEVDHISCKRLSADKVFDEMAEGNSGTTTCFRWLSWMMSVLGHYMLFTPIIRILSWIPLVGALLSKIIAFACIIFALLWASMLHFAVLAVAWIFYRPLFGFLMLLFVVGIGAAMCYGDGSKYDVSKLDLDIDQYYGAGS